MYHQLDRYCSTRTRTLQWLALAWTGLIAALPLSASQSISFKWKASDTPDVAGYNLYYGPAPASYTNLLTLGNVTNATITGLNEGSDYYFMVTAVSVLGMESLPSNEVYHRMPDLVMLNIKPTASSGTFAITASGAVPTQWVVEYSSDLTTWKVLARGTSVVNVPIKAEGSSPRFFRLKAE